MPDESPDEPTVWKDSKLEKLPTGATVREEREASEQEGQDEAER